jgi:hypothetical protein
MRNDRPIVVQMEDDSDSLLHLICNSQTFPIRRNVLVDNSDLFVDHSVLLKAGTYSVRTSVSPEVFQSFLSALQGDHVDITPTNVRELLSLSHEFGFRQLLGKCHLFTQSDVNPVVIAPLSPLNTTSSGGDVGGNPNQDRFSGFESRLTSVEDELSRLRKLIVGEQLYRQGREFLSGDGSIRQNISLGLSLLKRSADLCHSDSAFRYGLIMRSGEICERNLDESAKYFKASADCGNSSAQHSYGICVRNGEGKEKDFIESARYFKMSADQGNSDGQNSYALCLQKGEGVERDLCEAAKYFKMSADQGNSEGQNAYALCLQKGEGIERDLCEAAKYFKMSADQGNSDGHFHYGIWLDRKSVV